jgi:hypothetical protein
MLTPVFGFFAIFLCNCGVDSPTLVISVVSDPFDDTLPRREKWFSSSHQLGSLACLKLCTQLFATVWGMVFGDILTARKGNKNVGRMGPDSA